MLPAYPFESRKSDFKDLGQKHVRFDQYFPSMEIVFDNFSTCYNYATIISIDS